MYTWFPNNFFAIIFPVNESIWEHMKIIFGVFVFGAFFEKHLLNKFNVLYNNLELEVVTKGLVGIIFYLIIYIPIYFLLSDSFFIAIILLIITFVLMELLGIKILNSDNLNIKIMPIITIILMYLLFAILTFYPKHNFLFYDTNSCLYGIPKKNN